MYVICFISHIIYYLTSVLVEHYLSDIGAVNNKSDCECEYFSLIVCCPPRIVSRMLILVTPPDREHVERCLHDVVS